MLTGRTGATPRETRRSLRCRFRETALAAETEKPCGPDSARRPVAGSPQGFTINTIHDRPDCQRDAARRRIGRRDPACLQGLITPAVTFVVALSASGETYLNAISPRCKTLVSFSSNPIIDHGFFDSREQDNYRLSNHLARHQNAFDPRRIDVSLDKIAVPEDSLVEGDRGVDSFDHQLVEGPAHLCEGLGAVNAVDDELSDERVVIRGDGVADLDVGVPADAGAAGDLQVGDLSGGRAEVVLGVFGVDPDFEGMAAGDDFLLGERQFFAGRDPDLLLDEVDARDHFGDGVLDLDARVDFDEVELVIGVDEELAGAGVDVSGGLREPDRGVAELGADLNRERGGGGFLDEFLVAALE